MDNQLALELKEVTKEYPGFSLKMDLALPQGAILGLIGSNGAGKTTTLRMILGLAAPDSGSIRLWGQDVSRLPPAVREEIGVVFDENSFHESRTPLQMGRILSGIYRTWDTSCYSSLLERLELPARKKIQDFSRGMKMKLAIACALSHRPRLLLLDEPTSGLDPVVRLQILDIFQEFLQDETHSILLSSHITTDLSRIADYVVFMDRGRIILQGEKDALLEHYGILKGPAAQAEELDPSEVLGLETGPHGFSALVRERSVFRTRYPHMVIDPPTLDDILFYLTRGDGK